MKWPRSLREFRDVTSRVTRPKNVNEQPTPVDYGYGPHPFPGQGSFPAIPPTPTQTVFAPHGPDVSNTQGVASHPWPHNGATDSASPSAGRSAANATDYLLQTGPAPGRIQRALFERVQGYVGPQTGAAVGIVGLPTTQETSWLPHIPTIRQIYATHNYKTYDDNAVISAVYAGNPRP